ncbi:GNAT family N-acetyltransferase [Patescibacteria group bacterium]
MERLNIKKIGISGVEISIPDGVGGSLGSVVVGTEGTNSHIGWVGTRPDSRKCGFGETLLCDAEVWAKGQGSKTMSAHFLPVPGSERAVLRLFQKRGFSINKSGEATKNLT